MKLKTYVTAGLLTLGAPLAAQAGVNLQFDTNTSAGVVELNAFDWAQNSFLAEGGAEAIIARANLITAGDPDGSQTDCGTACDFTVYTHGTLNSATLDGAPVWSPQFSGDDPVEVTFTLSFTETVVSADFTTSKFEVVTDSVTTIGSAVFEMYFDTNVNADAVSGSGYNDGTLILFGDLILDSDGNFTLDLNDDGSQKIEDIDQSGTNDYPGQLTASGSGTQGVIEIGGLVQDNDFFKSNLAAFGFDFSNLSQEVPFTNVSPSDCYTNTSNGGVDGANVGSSFGLNGCNSAHIDGTFEQNEAGATGLVPVTGTINGFPLNSVYQGQACAFDAGDGNLGTNCPDFVAQTDPNSGVQIEQVPAPGTLAITGLGLLLLGARRRNNKA